MVRKGSGSVTPSLTRRIVPPPSTTKTRLGSAGGPVTYHGLVNVCPPNGASSTVCAAADPAVAKTAIAVARLQTLFNPASRNRQSEERCPHSRGLSPPADQRVKGDEDAVRRFADPPPSPGREAPR